MKFNLEKASDYNFEEEIEINTFDDLKNLSAMNGGVQLIIKFKGSIKYDEPPSITLYDDYVE